MPETRENCIHKFTSWFVRNAEDFLALDYELWLMRECQSERPPKNSKDAYNRWSRGIKEAKHHVNQDDLFNLENAEARVRSLGKKVSFLNLFI
jgi:hypothetical protein